MSVTPLNTVNKNKTLFKFKKNEDVTRRYKHERILPRFVCLWLLMLASFGEILHPNL